MCLTWGISLWTILSVKTFLNNVVGHFNIGPSATQVGVVQYSSTPQQEFALNAHSSLAGLQQAISDIAVIGRGTSTGSALTFARDLALQHFSGARPGVPKIVVVVTDGRSGDDVILPSQNLHSDGVITFAIGVTEMINYQELSAIAGSPDRVSTVFDFDALDDIKETLSSQLCEVETTTLKPTTTTTQTPKPTTTTTQTPKPTTTPTPATLPTPKPTTLKPVTPQEDAPMSNDVVNIGNECLGDVLCGDRVTCSARGDPHYRTFDGKRFNFQGNCKYVLSRGQDFTVSARNANRRGNMRVSFVDSVDFTLYGQTVSITQGKEVFVNGLKITLPYCIGGFASISQQGNNIVIDTVLCITVTFDGNHHVTVELPAHLAGHVGGLCGNANGLQGDDLVKPDLTPAQNGVEFGNSWVAEDDLSCPAVLADQQFDIAQADQAFVQELESQQFCGQMQASSSPFSACFAAVEPAGFMDDCVYDMAATGSTADHAIICENFEGYVQACGAAGIHIEGWREQTGCALQCPPHSHYSYSTSACQDSCRTPTASSACGLPDVEGCECDPGYIWSGMTCVEPRDCGCLHEMNYHTLGEQWGTEDGQQCECQPNFQVSCAPMSCLPGAVWSLQDGVYGCHQVPTLKPTTTTTQTPKPTTTPTPTTTTPTPTTTTQTPKPTTTPTPPASIAACQMQADIVFVVDGSASVPGYEFEKI
ncbi:zonadhesin-like [Branchiostoma lanceolatum]|uniref:zonadhesin-like n=1 Tax=Branchiostoma lanceolatum TaxID=7740 RepID=UPI0034540764